MIKKSKCVRLSFEGGVIEFEDLQAFFYACLGLDPQGWMKVQVVTSLLDRTVGSLSFSVEDE